MFGTDITPEMAKAKELLPINKKAYEEKSKKDQVKTHVGSGSWYKMLKVVTRLGLKCF